MFDFTAVSSPVILPGSDTTAYRDPAVYYENGTFYLFCTYVECLPDGPVMTTVLSTSCDLIHWSTPAELTPREMERLLTMLGEGGQTLNPSFDEARFCALQEV